jgi:hypothetical protein
MLFIALHSAATAVAAESVASQITTLPLGTRVELHLKNKQKIRGTTGVVSGTGFALVDASAAERQIAFDDVASVKVLDKKPHTKRNVAIGVGIAVGAAAVVVGIIYAVALHEWKTARF